MYRVPGSAATQPRIKGALWILPLITFGSLGAFSLPFVYGLLGISLGDSGIYAVLAFWLPALGGGLLSTLLAAICKNRLPRWFFILGITAPIIMIGVYILVMGIGFILALGSM